MNPNYPGPRCGAPGINLWSATFALGKNRKYNFLFALPENDVLKMIESNKPFFRTYLHSKTDPNLLYLE